MAARLRVLVDLDETIVNLLAPWLASYNHRWRDTCPGSVAADRRGRTSACGRRIVTAIGALIALREHDPVGFFETRALRR